MDQIVIFVGISSDRIIVREHFFKTGEKLIYNPGTGNLNRNYNN